MAKPQKNTLDLDVILYYLWNMPKIKGFLDFSSDVSILKQTLCEVASSIKYQFFHNRSVLFRFGEKGYKFYFILKGFCSILSLKEEKMYLKKTTFYNYLVSLMTNNEPELLIKTLIINQLQFGYNIDQDGKFSFTLVKPLITNRFGEKIANNLDDHIYIKIKKYLDNYRKKSKEKDDVEDNTFEEKTPSEYIENLSYFLESNDLRRTEIRLMSSKTEFIGGEINTNRNKGETEREHEVFLFNFESIDENSKNLHLSIYNYIHIIDLVKGDKFGDAALESLSSKRNSTVITSDDCH